MSFKNTINNNLKNVLGWKTNRKLLAFAVDDYGNIGLHSLKAKIVLLNNNVALNGRFSELDALDTTKDFEDLFEILSSVKDSKGRFAIFTTYALPANVDFKKTLEKGLFVPENLNETYEKLSSDEPISYGGALELLKEGINSELIRPQFHGREHLNQLVFNRLISDNNRELLLNLKQQSIAGIPNHSSYPNVRVSEAFSYSEESEVENHKEIIIDGINRFIQVYGYRPTSFTPPAMLIHPKLYPFLEQLGFNAIDKPRKNRVHLGKGKYHVESNKLGIRKDENHVTIVRNCLFEPNSRNINWVDFTFAQIKAAFYWGKPAIISSHRVNYCGHIDPMNRVNGLRELKSLLEKVVRTWPEIEFVSVDELANIIIESKQ